ncbi:hypothetical protein FHG87_024239 [Trinorchestia longiramus]|nr:hypothetical protein FHG87_024239 [Trinorchestia longiramus]
MTVRLTALMTVRLTALMTVRLTALMTVRLTALMTVRLTAVMYVVYGYEDNSLSLPLYPSHFPSIPLISPLSLSLPLIPSHFPSPALVRPSCLMQTSLTVRVAASAGTAGAAVTADATVRILSFFCYYRNGKDISYQINKEKTKNRKEATDKRQNKEKTREKAKQRKNMEHENRKETTTEINKKEKRKRDTKERKKYRKKTERKRQSEKKMRIKTERKKERRKAASPRQKSADHRRKKAGSCGASIQALPWQQRHRLPNKPNLAQRTRIAAYYWCVGEHYARETGAYDPGWCVQMNGPIHRTWRGIGA